MIRIRSWAGGHPLPNMDIKTGSWPIAVREARTLAAKYGSWDDVSVIVPGERPIRGDELRNVCDASCA